MPQERPLTTSKKKKPFLQKVCCINGRIEDGRRAYFSMDLPAMMYWRI